MESNEQQAGVAERTKFCPPPQYKVILLNDDYTTKDFVVMILESVFHRTEAEAVVIMEAVHQTGKGVAGVYVYDIAATKANSVHLQARKQGFPLRCELQKC